MYSFEIQNRANHAETKIIFGYSWKDAFRRSALNADEWDIISSEYED